MSDLNNQTLYLNGTSLPIKSLDVNKCSPNDDFAYLEEEIIEQEGTYEELLAYDNQEEEYMFEHNKRLNLNKRRRHGLPPISPKAAMKDLVANMIFDYLWSELIKCSEPTIRSYYTLIKEGQLLHPTITIIEIQRTFILIPIFFQVIFPTKNLKRK